MLTIFILVLAFDEVLPCKKNHEHSYNTNHIVNLNSDIDYETNFITGNTFQNLHKFI